MAVSPLFDIFDPQEAIRRRMAAAGLREDDEEMEITGAFPVKRKAEISDLMPVAQQKSLLSTLASMGSSGLSGLGWILDTPGAVVRGTLSGGPLKGLSALWETTDQRVDGRELLRQYGLAGSDDNWGNFGSGIGAEILLDPMTYLSFGTAPLAKQALTRTGRIARSAGLLDDIDVLARAAGTGPRQFIRKQTPRSLLESIADTGVRQEAQDRLLRLGGDLDKPVARMNRVSFPFMQDGATDLLGERIGDAVAKFNDQLGEGMMTNRFTGPIATRAVAAFDPSVMGQTDYARQLEARDLTAAEKAAQKATRRQLAVLQYDAEQALQPFNLSLNDPQVSSAMRYALEEGDEMIPDALRPAFSTPAMQEVMNWFRQLREEAPRRAASIGIPLETFAPRGGGQMVPRQQAAFDLLERPSYPKGLTPAERIRRPFGRAPKPVQVGDTAGRRRDYTDVMGQTRALNLLSLNPDIQSALRNAPPAQAQQIIRQFIRSNPDLNLDDDLYAWIDRLADDARAGEAGDIEDFVDAADLPRKYMYDVPKLPDDHPLTIQRRDLEQQVEVAIAAREEGEVARLKAELRTVKEAEEQARRGAYRDSLYQDLGGFLRNLDPQHARKGVPVFGLNTFNELANYALKRTKSETLGEGLLDLLSQRAEVGRAVDKTGGVNITAREALGKLGLTEDAIPRLERELGESIDNISFNENFINQWTNSPLKGRAPAELNPLLEAADNFTKSFKTLALAWPSRYTRDAYSGAFAAAMRGAFNPIDWWVGTQIRKGNYKPLTEGSLGGLIGPRLAKGEYAELFRRDPQAALRQFLADAGGQGLGTSTFSDEVASGANTTAKEFFPGAAKPTWRQILDRAYDPNRTLTGFLRDMNPLATRTQSGNRNPILELADRAAETTDAGNRYGTYLNRIRKGDAPSEAARITNLTQVDYRPEAFTDFERRYLKRVFPFYSYTRGIMPLIYDELMTRPQGLMGKSIRLINRGSEPSEDNFVPEYLRQSASIPLPEGLEYIGVDPKKGLKRFLTNIDLPFESAINLLTPGTGNTLLEKLGNTVNKTALNILGQSNPLIKGPLESITNRQFYSGRQLSDLYSVLEQTLGAPGRPLEQAIVNLPGGSRAIGTYRQLTDDRLSPQEKYSKFLVNALTGLKFQDVDIERTRRLAARDMLNQLLSTTPGVRTYENITVPPEVLAQMPREQQEMYLLYKIIQAEAAKRAREKKKRQSLDALQLLGVVQQ